MSIGANVYPARHAKHEQMGLEDTSDGIQVGDWIRDKHMHTVQGVVTMGGTLMTKPNATAAWRIVMPGNDKEFVVAKGDAELMWTKEELAYACTLWLSHGNE